MKFQKLAFFRDAPAPWQGPPPGGPDSLTAVTSMRGKYANRNALSLEMQPASELDDIVNSPKYEALL